MKGAFVFAGLSRITAVIALALIVPIFAGLCAEDGTARFFVPSFFIAAAGTAAFALGGRTHKRQMRLTEGAVLLFVCWFVMAAIGALPFYIGGCLTGADAWLESMSAFTTNGSFIPVHAVPPSLRVWHVVMEWTGALIFINLFVTVVPQISKVFNIGLSGDNPFAFTPGLKRMKVFMKHISIVYAVVTAVTAVAFRLAGVSLDTAVLQAFATVSTGGTALVDLHERNIAWAAVCGMFLASCNFLLLFKVLRERSFRSFFRNTEFRAFLAVIFTATLVLSITVHNRTAYEWGDSLRLGLFHVLSFMSTTGFIAPGAAGVPEFDRLLLFLLTFVGGCVGAATGGLKVIRFLILFKMTGQELVRTLHPQMVITVKVNNVSVPLPVISRVLNVFFLFIAVFFLSALVLSLAGLSPLQALGLAGAGLTGTGASASLYGLDDLYGLPLWLKVYYTFIMVLGRIEVVAFFLVMQTAVHFLRRRW